MKIQKEKAVSSVIGVILMVAITVAMASTAFLYTQNILVNKKEPLPNIQFLTDDVNDRIIIINPDKEIQWSKLKLRTYTSNVNFAVNEEITLLKLGASLPENIITNIAATETIEGSDFMDFEGYDGINPVSVQSVSISIVYQNTVIYSTSFSSIDAVS